MTSIHRISAIALAALALALGAAPAQATDKKVDVLGIPADMLRIGKTRCVVPNVCFKKDAPTIASYDPGVIGSPKFRPGEVTLRDGTVLKGTVALLNTAADWEFVKQVALVIPEGESAAIFVGQEDALLIRQEQKDGTDIYDRYGNGYLRRLVSGRMRLSYNPAAGTSRPLSDFVPAGVLNNLSGALGREAVIAALRDGKTVGESLGAGKSLGSAVSDALGSIEITEKEYLLYDEQSGTLTSITKASHGPAMERMFAACPAADPKQVKALARNYGKIAEAVTYYNSVCG
jgi:hypothetical protein